MAQELSQLEDNEVPELRIKTDDELWDAVRDQTGITIPRVKVCENHVAPFTAFADAFFSRSRNAVWLASRGFGGKSVLLATLAFMEGVEQGAAVNLLGGSGEQSQRVHGYMTGEDTNLPRTFWGYYGAPKHLLLTDPTKKETRLSNGGRIVVLQASTRSVRGPHPQKLLLDECDEMTMEIFNAATGQTMSARGIQAQTVMSSTHQYAAGTFTEILRMAAERAWPVYTWCISGDSIIMGVTENKQLKDIRIGDAVYAYEKGKLIETTVTDAWQNGIKPTIIIETGAGSITCTADHRILTDKGWREAGDLRQGDLVYSVQNKKSKNICRNGQNFISWTLPIMFERSSLPQLWKANRRRIKVLPSMSWDIGFSPSSRIQSDSKDRLSRLRRKKTGRIENMCELLSCEAIEAEQGASWNDGSRSSVDSFIRDKSEEEKQIPFSCSGITGHNGNFIPGGTTNGAVCSRFPFVRLSDSNRSERGILAQSSGADRAGSAQENRDQEFLSGVNSSQYERNSSLGFTVVKEIRHGLNVPVYDLTVAEGESFIANRLIVHNCYKETAQGWLPQREIDEKRGDVSTAMWEVEYDLQEPNPGARAIDPEKVKLMFDKSLGEVSGQLRKYYEFEEPKKGAVYVHGADWAKKVDNTVIISLRIDVSPMRLVAFERRNKEPWPVMVKRLEDRITRYGGKGAHDATGLGDVIKDYLLAGVKDFIMVGRARSELLNDYVTAIEQEAIVSPHIEFMYSEHLYASVNDLYGGMKYHLPDTISSGALAYHPSIRRGWSRGRGA